MDFVQKYVFDIYHVIHFIAYLKYHWMKTVMGEFNWMTSKYYGKYSTCVSNTSLFSADIGHNLKQITKTY